MKLRPVMACYKTLLGQLYQKMYAYTETLTQILSVNFEKKKKKKKKKMNTTTKPLRDCL